MWADFGPPAFKARREVVVTGLGIICALGSGSEQVWQRLLSGRCGVRSLREDELPQVRWSSWAVDPAYRLPASAVCI